MVVLKTCKRWEKVYCSEGTRVRLSCTAVIGFVKIFFGGTFFTVSRKLPCLVICNGMQMSGPSEMRHLLD